MVKFEEPGRDPFEARVRETLHRLADGIQPHDDGLDRIRTRTARAPGASVRTLGGGRRWLAVSAAGLATAAAITGVATLSGDLLSGSPAPGPVTPPPAQSPAPATGSPTAVEPTPSPEGTATDAEPEPSPEPSPEPTPEPTPEPSQQTQQPPTEQTGEPGPPREVTVPVYYLGQTTTGPRLFREFHAVQTTQSRAVTAVNQMLGQDAVDPDYTSPWAPGTRALSVEHTGGVITVDLSSQALDTTAPAAAAELGVQQLVYTVTAALQSSDPVQILVAGEPVPAISGAPTAQPLGRADPLQVQAMTWITAPVHGATVPSTFVVTGVANAFEATVVWQLRDGQRVVREGSATAAEGAAFSPYSFRVRDVPPGSYTLEVYQESAATGAKTFVDSKRLTVR